MYLLTQPTQNGEVNLPTFHIIKVIHIMYFSFTTPPPLQHIYYPVICCFAVIYSISVHWTKSSTCKKIWSSPRHQLSTKFLILEDSTFNSPLRGIISCNLQSLFKPGSKKKKSPFPFTVNDCDINSELQWYLKDSYGPWRLCKAAWGLNNTQLIQQVASFALWKTAAASLGEENTPRLSQTSAVRLSDLQHLWSFQAPLRQREKVAAVCAKVVLLGQSAQNFHDPLVHKPCACLGPRIITSMRQSSWRWRQVGRRPDSSVLQTFGYSPIQPLAQLLGYLLGAQPWGLGSRGLCDLRTWDSPVQWLPLAGRQPPHQSLA